MKRLPIQQRSSARRLRHAFILPHFAPRNQFQLGDSGPASVQPVAQHGAADVRQMNPNLMRTTRFGERSNQCVTGKPLHDFIQRDGLPRVCVFATNGLLLPLRGVRTDRLIDNITIAIRHAHHDGKVLLFYCTRLELGSKRIVRPIVLGHDDYTARIAIEPMDDAGPRRSAAATERAEMMGQRTRQRPFPMALCRVNDHSGRLVDDDNRVILVENDERNVLRRGPFAWRGNLLDKHPAAGPQTQRRLAPGIIHAHMTRINRPPERGPAESGQLFGEKHVQPLPRLFRRDKEALGPRWEFGRQWRGYFAGESVLGRLSSGFFASPAGGGAAAPFEPGAVEVSPGGSVFDSFAGGWPG